MSKPINIFKVEKKTIEPKDSEIKSLKIKVRVLTQKDIDNRKLPKNSSGLVITNIEKDSPLNNLEVNNIVVEAQKKKIRSKNDLERIIDSVLKSNEKTMLIVVYDNQNQRRYIGVKLD